MTYGFLIRNNANEVLLDENYDCVQFLGKVTLTPGTVTATDAPGIYQSIYTSTSISIPSTSTGVLSFVTLPSSTNVIWYETDVPYYKGTLYGSANAVARGSVGMAPATLEAYLFSTNNHKTPSSSDYGIQLKNSSNRVTFDSRNTPLSIMSLGPTVTFSDTPTAYTVTGLPSKPAFLMPYYFINRSSKTGSKQTTETESRGALRRNGSTLYAYESVGFFFQYDGLVDIFTDTVGPDTAQVPFINASLYD